MFVEKSKMSSSQKPANCIHYLCMLDSRTRLIVCSNLIRICQALVLYTSTYEDKRYLYSHDVVTIFPLISCRSRDNTYMSKSIKLRKSSVLLYCITRPWIAAIEKHTELFIYIFIYWMREGFEVYMYSTVSKKMTQRERQMVCHIKFCSF